MKEITPKFCTGIAKLTIPETGEVFEVSSDDLDWESECSDPDRGMGPEFHHSATTIFDSEQGDYQIEVTWNIWEYPIGAINLTSPDIQGGEVLKDFDSYQLPPEDEV